MSHPQTSNVALIKIFVGEYETNTEENAPSVTNKRNMAQACPGRLSCSATLRHIVSATSPLSSWHVSLNPHFRTEMLWDPGSQQWRRSREGGGGLTWLRKQLKTLESPLSAPWPDKAFKEGGTTVLSASAQARLLLLPVPLLCWSHICCALIPMEHDPPFTAQLKATSSMELFLRTQPSNHSLPGSLWHSLALNYFLSSIAVFPWI